MSSRIPGAQCLVMSQAVWVWSVQQVEAPALPIIDHHDRRVRAKPSQRGARCCRRVRRA